MKGLIILHNYSTDKDDKKIYFWIMILSIMIATFLHFSVIPNLNIPENKSWILGYFDIPALPGIYTALLLFYSRTIWPLTSGITNLSGTWKGKVISSYNGSTPRLVTVKITQTWKTIQIISEFDDIQGDPDAPKSKSKSVVASFKMMNLNDMRLSFEYENSGNQGTLNKHSGYNVLNLSEDGTILEGFYYTDGHRGNYGNMRIEKEKKIG